jgi:major type 1 subunit fimbrin (pilin)
MKMKYSLLAAALAFGLVGIANADQNSGPDGTITINGKVVAQTCQVDGNGLGTADNKVVTLPNVLTTALAATGDTAGDTGFNISVTGCDASLSTVQAYFSGGDVNSGNGRLDNSATGAASNVQVQLLNASDAPMDLSGANATAQSSQQVSLSGGAATLSYKARYYATGASSAGAVKSTVDFTLIYQ